MKIIYQPFVRDEDVNIPLSLPFETYFPRLTTSKEIESSSPEESKYVQPTIVDPTQKTNPVQETSIPETSEVPTEVPKVEVPTQPSFIGHNITVNDIGNMQWFLDLAQKYNIPLRVTSGKRNGSGVSHHDYGDALDITPIDYDNSGSIEQSEWDTLAEAIRNASGFRQAVEDQGYRILDETREDVLAKTGGTGKHLHIGPDSYWPTYHPEYEYQSEWRIPKAKSGIKLNNPGKAYSDGKDFVQNWISQRTEELSENINDTLPLFTLSGDKESKRMLNYLNFVKYDNFELPDDALGAFNKRNRSMTLRDPENDIQASIHEWTHASDPRFQIAKIDQIKKSFGNHIYSDPNTQEDEYLDKSSEIYSRLMELRHILDLDPNKKYSFDEIKELINSTIDTITLDRHIETPDGKRAIIRTTSDKDYNIKSNNAPSDLNFKTLDYDVRIKYLNEARDILNRYNEFFIEQLINDVASNKKSDNKIRV